MSSRPPLAFFLFCAEDRPKIKGEHPGLSIGDAAKKLGEMRNPTAAGNKQPGEKNPAKMKEKYGKETAAWRVKGEPDAAKRESSRLKKKQEKEG